MPNEKPWLYALVLSIAAFVAGIVASLFVAVNIAERSWESVQEDADIFGDARTVESNDEFIVRWALSNITHAEEKDIDTIIRLNCVLLEGWSPKINPTIWKDNPARRQQAEELIAGVQASLTKHRESGACLTSQ